MRKLEEIEDQIRNLSGAELGEFRKWYAEFDAQSWDAQFEADVKAGKLDRLAEAARLAYKEGKSTEL
jgi:major membrane immunogen (membrane-anchored lipoprotein)